MEEMEREDSHQSTASKGGLQSSSTSKQRSNSTVASDWTAYLSHDAITVSLSPWGLYKTFRNARILTVEPVVLLYFFGMYLTISLFQQYYLKRYALDTLRNTSYPYINVTRCLNKSVVNLYTGRNTTYNTVEKDATLIYVMRSLVSTAIVMVTTLVMGPLSDRFGRRLIMGLVAVGGVLQGLGSLAIAYYNLSMYYFAVIGAIEGVFGNFASMIMSTFSYLSDITSGKWRTVRIGIAESMVFLGGLVALEVGAVWFQETSCNIMYPLYLYIACNVAIILYILLFLPESLTAEERQRQRVKKQSKIRGMLIFFCRVKGYPVWKLWIALIALGVVIIKTMAEALINTFFLKDLNWSPKKIGNFQTVSTAARMVFLMLVLPFLVALKIPDIAIALLSLAASIAMGLLLGLASSTLLLFIGGTLLGVVVMTMTSLRAYLSKIVSLEDQGALFSVVAVVESFCSMIAISYTYVLPVLLHHNIKVGMVYVILAALGLVPLPFLSILLVAWCREKYLSAKKTTPNSVTEDTPILNADS